MRVEDHDHRKGVCDFDGVQYWCEFNFTREHYYTSGIYGRPKSEQVYRAKANGKDRTRWRLAASEMLKMPIEELEDYDFQNFPHRHSALWDAF